MESVRREGHCKTLYSDLHKKFVAIHPDADDTEHLVTNVDPPQRACRRALCGYLLQIGKLYRNS